MKIEECPECGSKKYAQRICADCGHGLVEALLYPQEFTKSAQHIARVKAADIISDLKKSKKADPEWFVCGDDGSDGLVKLHSYCYDSFESADKSRDTFGDGKTIIIRREIREFVEDI